MGATKLETSIRGQSSWAAISAGGGGDCGHVHVVGETMVVAIAAGSGPRNFGWNRRWRASTSSIRSKAAETVARHIVRISGGDLSYESIEYGQHLPSR